MDRRRTDRRLCLRHPFPNSDRLCTLTIGQDKYQCTIDNMSCIGFKLKGFPANVLNTGVVCTLSFRLKEEQHFLKVQCVWVNTYSNLTVAGVALYKFSQLWLDTIHKLGLDCQ